MMKQVKIIALCLCLALVASLAFLPSCVQNGEVSPEVDEFDDIADIIAKSNPTAYDCDISYGTADITLYGRYVLLFTEIDGKKCAKLTYEYDKLNEIGASDEFISTLTGTLYARGEGEINEMISSVVNGDKTAKFALPSIKKDMFESYDITEKGGVITLSGKLKEDAGNALISLECDKENRRVSKVLLEYTDEGGAEVLAKYLFSYEAQNFEIE